MNRFAFVLSALSLLIAGCKDVDIDPQAKARLVELWDAALGTVRNQINTRLNTLDQLVRK